MSLPQTLTVPTASITEVKRSPSNVFALAESANNAVYVFNRGTVSGVMLSRAQYEDMAARLESLEERLFEAEVANRLASTSVKTYTDKEVRGEQSSHLEIIDDEDGWE
jgi:PHD/YefM family antitoxin component YafN of YafNO toxin-antitoxin module